MAQTASNDQTQHVRNLIKKAGEADNAAAAINFSQAACNCANALRVLAEFERMPAGARPVAEPQQAFRKT